MADNHIMNHTWGVELLNPFGLSFKNSLVPELNDDETLYSFICRWHLVSAGKSPVRFIIECFGVQAARPYIERNSTRTLHFFHALPEEHSLRQANQPFKLITSLSYYSYLHPKEMREMLLAPSPLWNDDKALIRMMQSLRSPFSSRKNPAACLECIKEDLKAHGFTWWRRSHQLRGVGRCHKHGCSLIIGCCRCGPWITSSYQLALPTLTCNCEEFLALTVVEAEWTGEEAGRLIALVGAQMLMDDEPLDLGLMRQTLRTEVVRRYRDRAASKWDALAYDLVKFAGNAYVLSNSRGTPFKNAKRISREACGQRVKRVPIERYVILTALLFGDLNALKQAALQVRVNVNPPADVQPIKCSVHSNLLSPEQLRELLDRNAGEFKRAARECGLSTYVFARTIAQKCPDVIERGLTKRDKEVAPLVRTLFAEGEELKRIVSKTGRTILKVRMLTESVPGLREMREKALFEAKRDRYRAQFNELSRCGATRSEIRMRMSNSLPWMETSDPEWLSALYPERIKPKGKKKTGPTIDWAARDEEWAVKVPGVVEDLIDKQVHRVVRLRPYSVINAMGWNINLTKAADGRVPKTMAALKAHCETRSAYQFRRLVWVARHLCSRDKPLPMSAISRRTGIAIRDLGARLWLAGFCTDDVSMR